MSLRFGLPLALLCGALAILLPFVGIVREEHARNDLEVARNAARELDVASLGELSAETGERGYTITGNADFLDSYTSGRLQFDDAIAVLRGLHLPIGITNQVDQLEGSYQVWLIQFAEPQVELVRAGGLNAARARTASGLGRDLSETIQTKAANTGAAIDQEIASRQSTQEALNIQSDILAILGGIAAAVSGVIVIAGARQRWQAVHSLHATTEQLERERELGRRRADVLASVSHDLRSPLAGVVLQASLLEEEAEESGRADLVALATAARQGATRAALLVDELLDFARLEAGGMQLDIQPLELPAVLMEAVEDVRIARPSFSLELQDGIGREEPVPGDEERLRAVFRNVMDNACRYGKAPFRARLVTADGRVEVHIEDSGPGIPAPEREAIFRKFERGSTSAGAKGTGLGLYFSRELVALHGGSLNVENSSLGGADFVIGLPRGCSNGAR